MLVLGLGHNKVFFLLFLRLYIIKFVHYNVLLLCNRLFLMFTIITLEKKEVIKLINIR